MVSLLLFLMNRRRSTIAYLQGRTTSSALAEHATIFFVCSFFVAGSVSVSRPKVSSPLASGRHRECSPARGRVSYDDRRIVFSYACFSAVAMQDARARDRRPTSRASDRRRSTSTSSSILIPYLQGAHNNEHKRSVHDNSQETSALQSRREMSSSSTDEAKILINDNDAMASRSLSRRVLIPTQVTYQNVCES